MIIKILYINRRRIGSRASDSYFDKDSELIRRLYICDDRSHGDHDNERAAALEKPQCRLPAHPDDFHRRASDDKSDPNDHSTFNGT